MAQIYVVPFQRGVRQQFKTQAHNFHILSKVEEEADGSASDSVFDKVRFHSWFMFGRFSELAALSCDILKAQLGEALALSNVLRKHVPLSLAHVNFHCLESTFAFPF